MDQAKMFTVTSLNDFPLCECTSFTDAHRIAVALRQVAETSEHFAVLRGDEMVWTSKDGMTNTA